MGEVGIIIRTRMQIGCRLISQVFMLKGLCCRSENMTSDRRDT